MLSVGKTLTQETRDHSIAGPGNPILVSASVAAKGMETAFEVFSGARKTKAYERAMEKVNTAKAAKKA
jgi:hypothetical protein